MLCSVISSYVISSHVSYVISYQVMARYVKICYEIIDKGLSWGCLMLMMFSIVRTISSHLSSISGMNSILVWAVCNLPSRNGCASFQSLSLSWLHRMKESRTVYPKMSRSYGLKFVDRVLSDTVRISMHRVLHKNSVLDKTLITDWSVCSLGSWSSSENVIVRIFHHRERHVPFLRIVNKNLGSSWMRLLQ